MTVCVLGNIQTIPFPAAAHSISRQKKILNIKRMEEIFLFHSHNRFSWLNSTGGSGSVDSLLYPAAATSMKSHSGSQAVLEYLVLSMDNI